MMKDKMKLIFTIFKIKSVFTLLGLILFSSCGQTKYSKSNSLNPKITANSLTENEEKNGWQLLWDGKTTKGWRAVNMDKFPEGGWEIENGQLSVLESGGKKNKNGGDIVSVEKYSDFELKVDFKLTKGANSGIKYYIETQLKPKKGPSPSVGLEYQILDDANHPEAKLGNLKGSRKLASLYDLVAADTNKIVNPIGEWNRAYIKSVGNHVEHWLNGKKVLEYERKSPEYLKLVSESKYKKRHKFGEADAGHILLQDHGTHVSFRNIKIRPLSKNQKK